MALKQTVSTNLSNLSKGALWRAHVDGFKNGALVGWALRADDPMSRVHVDLYVRDIYLKTAVVDIDRVDLQRITGLPVTTGFAIALDNFCANGAEAVLLSLEETAFDPDADFEVRIAGTPHVLPGANKSVADPQVHEQLRKHLLMALGKRARDRFRSAPQTVPTPLEQIAIVANSPLFDPDWYCQTYGTLADGLDPIIHYLEIGAHIGRDAGPWFSTSDYLEAVPEGGQSLLNPLVHYEMTAPRSDWWPGRARLAQPATETAASDYAVLIHISDPGRLNALQTLKRRFPETTPVCVSYAADMEGFDIEAVTDHFPKAEIFETSPYGDHVAAFLEAVRRTRKQGYLAYCAIHLGYQGPFNNAFHRQILDGLAATQERVNTIVEMFQSNDRLLLAGPAPLWLNGRDFLGKNDAQLKEVLPKIGFVPSVTQKDCWGFFPGGCFWIQARLATMIALALQTDMLAVDDTAEDDQQMMTETEHLFGLAVAVADGDVALSVPGDWSAPPKVIRGVDHTVRLKDPETPDAGLFTLLSQLDMPRLAPDGETGSSKTEKTRLHDEIDVMISCWNSQPELLHSALAELESVLGMQGLTTTFVVSSKPVRDTLAQKNCSRILQDRIYLDFPIALDGFENVPGGQPFGWDKAVALVQCESIFRGLPMLEGADLEHAVARVRRVYAAWRAALIHHKVKLFLIWGDTAPKSRLLISLCQDLRIEYLVIERGHFPGTLSYDPKGQFGKGARMQLLECSKIHTERQDDDYVTRRFDEIANWYAQQSHASYAHTQKHDTAELAKLRRARAAGRPIILLIGANDPGSGVASPGVDTHRTNWFGTSREAFSVIHRQVCDKFPEALLVIRPHPSDKLDDDMKFVVVASDTSLDDLIDVSDICISIGTTANALCLIKGKPHLGLGLTDLSSRNVGYDIVDETHLLVALRRLIWGEPTDLYPNNEHKRYIVDLFDQTLLAVDASVPARFGIDTFGRFLSQRMLSRKSGFLIDYEGRKDQISKAMFEEVRDRGRAVFRATPDRFGDSQRPGISIVIPIYGDYEGTQVCFDLLAKYQKQNDYRVITVWDRGPDERLRDLCLEYADKAGFTYSENRENVGFSGSVNEGIILAGRDDVILLNSDTIPCGDWALRLQDAAYAHPKIASVVPFSNSATIFNLPFPNGTPLPGSDADAIAWIEMLDRTAAAMSPDVVEMPVAHGFCAYVRRSVFDRIGYFDEMKFSKGYGEDNEFSLRIRMAGYFCGCASNVVVGHAGSTSFSDMMSDLKLRGREKMHQEFSHYATEISHFLKTHDPLAQRREQITVQDGCS